MVSNETKVCRNCQQSFVIDASDFAFYERIAVPPPTWCWRCRMQRRLASREEGRALYKDACDLCKKDLISVYAPDSPFTVYCHDCWWSDKWNPLSYGQEYDFAKPFFQQFRDLLERVPREATRSRNSVDCRYCNSVVDSKNCYMVFGGYGAIDCMYGEPVMSRNTVDSDLIFNGNQTYENISCANMFRTKFVYYSDDCIDSSFLFDCKGCSNCFGGINLRNQSYVLFGRQLSKKDYFEQIKYWDIGSYAKLLKAKNHYRELYLKTPRRFSITTNVNDVVGDDLKNTQNCKTCFVTKNGVENAKYVYFGGLALKDSFDVASCGDTSQLLYESVSLIRSQRCLFSNGASNSHDIAYSERTMNSSYMFGCISARNKQYCILNKQYDKENYFAQISKIKTQMSTMPYMDAKGREYRYGEFFPAELSVWPYNEAWVFDNFPLSKEKALELGYKWRDQEKRNYQIDILIKDLPDHVRDTESSIADKVIECFHKGTCNERCTTAFRIIPEELDFYKQQNIALPRLCPNCRYYQRFVIRNPINLWHRKCMNPDTSGSGQPCDREFETAISPERPEIVYCEQCYKEAFL